METASLRICLVSSEVTPFAKTGGLADVVTGLARFLARDGHDVRVFMPFYRHLADRAVRPDVDENVGLVEVPCGRTTIGFQANRTTLPESDVPLYMIDCPALYDRGSIYTSDHDEHLRFGFLDRAVLETCQRLRWGPDIFHCNDWHAGLLPLYLRTLYAWDDLLRRSRSVFTIHNIGYQGTFAAETLDELGLASEQHLLHRGDMHQGRYSFLKTGVLYADCITTVSRTYAREIQTPELGLGVDELIRLRAESVFGIVNGVDYGDWNPAADALIPHNYDAHDLSGKLEMKRALVERFGLSWDPEALVFGVVSRLTHQKGFELFAECMPVLLQRENVRLIVLGTGEPGLEQFFDWLRDTHREQVGFARGYDNELAHWIEAGSDAFLMPSLYEPCGLNQMYSLRYGTPPLVRRTGGLADTVIPFDASTGEGTGFVFDEFAPAALFAALYQTLKTWRDQSAWRTLVTNCMAADWSWEHQGRQYLNLYRSLLQ